MEEEKAKLQVVNGSYIEEIPDTLCTIKIENPDDREYENVAGMEGGL